MARSAFPLTDDVLRAIIMDVLEEDDFIGPCQAGRKRQRYVHQNLHDSTWGRLLRDPSLLVVGSFLNRLDAGSVFLPISSYCIFMSVSIVLILFILSVV